MTHQELWDHPEHRKLIETAILETINTATRENDHSKIRFLHWCVEGAPWELWTQNRIAQIWRAKVFLENVPRFF
jgi:ferritin